MEDELWLTAREAADHCGISLVTVHSWARRRHLKVEGLDYRTSVTVIRRDGQALLRHEADGPGRAT
ncbi:hypothetical protein [Streptomyces sp. NBC_00388]|uniref:hypothetical protein n=1 Tax=Streptomyces sp. NBC_00388 TaxID=2975735 RepID=UPI002E210750